MIARSRHRDTSSRLPEPRTVAFVGRYAHRHVHDATGKTADCRVVLLESKAHAYSKIKRALPDLIVMCLSDDDFDGCQVLAMLALDSETSRIPVIIHMTADAADFGDLQTEPVENAGEGFCAMALN